MILSNAFVCPIRSPGIALDRTCWYGSMIPCFRLRIQSTPAQADGDATRLSAFDVSGANSFAPDDAGLPSMVYYLHGALWHRTRKAGANQQRILRRMGCGGDERPQLTRWRFPIARWGQHNVRTFKR